MKIQLKTVFGDLIFEGDFASIAEAVKAALRAGKSLSFANLRFANLSSADLSSADLRFADLRFADLSSANLRFANLSSADLSFADLSSADLRFADLSSANLSDTKGSKPVIAQTRILPEGSLIGWKKCRDGVIVKLRIPEEAKRSHAFGRKCRAEFAEVLEVVGADQGVSWFDSSVVYTKGATVKPGKPFDENYTEECAAGIHFFITREEAEAYSL